MRVLLTGASGYIGRVTLEALIGQGADVVAVSRRRPAVKRDYRWIEVDLLGVGIDAALIRSLGVDVVLHLAWDVEHGRFWAGEANLNWTAATLSLAQATREGGASRFIGVGTCYEYDWPTDSDCREADTPLHPRSLYAAAKDATRRLLNAYFAQHGIAFCWARPFFIYGGEEGQARLVPSICQALASGRPAPCSSGSAIRDYADVRDVGGALATLTASAMTGPVNVASGRAVSVAHIAETLGRLAERPDLIRLGALQDRVDDPARVVADASRIKSEVGNTSFRPLKQGLAEALSYWQFRDT